VSRRVGAAGWTLGATCTALALVGAAVASAPAQFDREVEATGPGVVAVTLDRHVYEAARADLADLRVLTASGEAVPFALDRGEAFGPRAEIAPVRRNSGTTATGAATAVLDFGEPTEKAALTLALPGDNFRRRVIVEGSEDGREWTTLTDDAWVFAVPGPRPARYESVPLPVNDFPLLRVTVHPGADERGRLAIGSAVVPAGEGPPRREATLVPRWSVAAGATGETWITLDLGARHQPFHAVTLEVEDERFLREVRVEARRDPPAGPDGAARPVRWEEIGRGVVYRFDSGGRLQECLALAVRGRERALHLRVRDGDDRPLRVAEVVVRVPVERLLFEAESGTRYRLRYGDSALGPPRYDLARTLGERADAAVAAGIGPPVRLAESARPPLPWTERHPALLWVGLVGVAVALAAITLRALRGA
jgi:hypothetical protein